MKRIEFIAPVEAMRGNLSGSQDLVYPTNDNKAYDAPKGVVSYARNYQPRFIGAKRAANGLKYFSVRTKSAIHPTVKSVKAMAEFGGAAALYAAVVNNRVSATYLAVERLYTSLKLAGRTSATSLRQYLMQRIGATLVLKGANVTDSYLGSSFSFKNPWFNGTQTSDCRIDFEVFRKFAPVLGPAGLFEQPLTLADGSMGKFFAFQNDDVQTAYTRGAGGMYNSVMDEKGTSIGVLAYGNNALKALIGQDLNGVPVNVVVDEETGATEELVGTDYISAESTYTLIPNEL